MKRFWPNIFREADGTPSSRRILFAFVVVASVAFAGGAVWATKAMSAEVVDLLKAALYATGGTLAAGKFAEGKGTPDA